VRYISEVCHLHCVFKLYGEVQNKERYYAWYEKISPCDATVVNNRNGVEYRVFLFLGRNSILLAKNPLSFVEVHCF